MFSNCELRSCSQTWRILDKTNDINIRHCQECNKDVFKANNMKEVEKITSEGNCIAYFNDRNADQMQAVDNDMLRENSHSSMTISKPERQSRVTFGGQTKKD